MKIGCKSCTAQPACSGSGCVLRPRLLAAGTGTAQPSARGCVRRWSRVGAEAGEGLKLSSPKAILVDTGQRGAEAPAAASLRGCRGAVLAAPRVPGREASSVSIQAGGMVAAERRVALSLRAGCCSQGAGREHRASSSAWH